MAITIDTSRPLRGPLELEQLVGAVVAAGSADEAFWIECKNNEFDLTQAHGRFKTSRAILSFANRMPDLAETTCGGLAYVIIGAEPGQVDGTTVHDGADLGNWLIKYLGGDGPAWTPNWVKYSGKDVLVIVAEAPKWGDRAHTLRQGYEKAVEGTIYYRSGSSSRPAKPDEVRLLENRLLQGQQAPQLAGLQVGYEIKTPRVPFVIVVDPSDQQMDEWIDQRRTAIEGWHTAVIDSYDKPAGLAGAAFAGAFRPRVDSDAIEQHLQICRNRLLDATRHTLINIGASLLNLTVASRSSRILEDVEMTIRIKAAHSAFEPGEPPSALPDLPKPPAPPKKRNPTSFFDPSSVALPARLGSYKMQANLFNPGIDIGDTEITLTVGRLRPEKPVSSPQFHLFLHERPADDQVEIEWTLSSTSTQGLQKGLILVPVHPNQHVFLPADAGLPKDAGRA